MKYAMDLFSSLKRKIISLKTVIKDQNTEINSLKLENEHLKNENVRLHNEQNTMFETQEKRINIAKKIGQAENNNLFLSSNESICNHHLFSFSSLTDINPQNLIQNQNPVVTAFIDSLTENKIESEKSRNTKMLKNAVAAECIMGARNKRYVSPLCAVPASIVYGVTGSRLAIDTINQLLPCGNYSHLISWLFKLHATDNSDDSVNLDSFSLFYAFDNNQRLLRSWLSRNFNKQVVQIMTNICRVRVNDVSKIQFKENLHPSSWRKFSNISSPQFHTYRHSSDVAASYNEFVSNYISKFINDIQAKDHIDDEVNSKIESMSTNIDTINCPVCNKAWKKRKVKCDVCKINMRAYRNEVQKNEKLNEKAEENAPPKFRKLKFHIYNPSENNDGKTKVDHSDKSKRMHQEKDPTAISLISPVFVNPGSKDSVMLVLDHIGKDAGIKSYGTGSREWCFVVCDGSPMTLVWQIIFENTEKYGWVVPITGLGHEEMNMTKGFIELVWEIIYKDFIESQGYISPKAQLFMKGCGNHHLSFDNLDKFREAIWIELLKPFILDKNVHSYNFESYLNWLETRNNNFTYSFVQNVVRYLDSVFIFREGVRKNDSKLIETARYLFADVWFTRKHTKYQLIFCFEALQRHIMPAIIKDFLIENEAFSKSGRTDAHQGLDFVLEEYNKSVKHWISGAPDYERWEKVILNIDNLAKLRSHFQNISGSSKDSVPKFLPPFTKERDAFRVHLRLTNFLASGENTKTKKKSPKICPEFHILNTHGTTRMKSLFSSIIENGYPQNRKHETVKKIPVTDIEESQFNDDENKTKSELRSEIEKLLNSETLLACEKESLKSDYAKIKNGKRDLLLVMLQLVRNECTQSEIDGMVNDID